MPRRLLPLRNHRGSTGSGPLLTRASALRRQAGLVEATKPEVHGRLRTTFALMLEGLATLRDYKKIMRQVLAAIPD